MSKPSREQIESMAFMAMMDGIGTGSFSCSCPTCKSERKSKPSVRGPPSPSTTRKTTQVTQTEGGKVVHKHEIHIGTCAHHHPPAPRSNSTGNKKPVTPLPTQPKPSPTPIMASSSVAQGRESKVNGLLKALTEKAIFDIFNLTPATNEEKALVQLIQDTTKDSKLYTEVKEKVMEICDDEDVDLDAVFGLLAKFRHERNLLITAILKSNGEREKSNVEREKALLCVKRVDDLMYMLQDVAKRPKDADGDVFMHKLGGIIMEIHDLAKAPSTLYDELLDIREEHFQLVDDHEEMHQKFMDVNSCHDKLHSNHDKLQQSHNKLKEEHTEVRKKASMVGGLKSDVTRLEKIIEKSKDETGDLKKEIERLTAELAKVNSLKHENAQLKKKVTTLSTPVPQAPEPTIPKHIPGAFPQTPKTGPAPAAVAGKRKKGKKGQNAGNVDVIEEPVVSSKESSESHIDASANKAKEDLEKLKKSHSSLTRDLETLRANLLQLEGLRRKADANKEETLEKFQLEKAKCQNWQDIARGHADDKEHMQGQVEHLQLVGSKLQSTIDSLEKSLVQVRADLVRQKEAHSKVKAELEERSQTPAISEPTSGIGEDTARTLHKIKAEISQLVGDLDEAKSYGGDIHVLLNMIQNTVRGVVMVIDRDIDEILNVKSCNGSSARVPDTIMPFSYGSANSARNAPNIHALYASRNDYSPQESPNMPFSSNIPPTNSNFGPFRPMIPPGFGDSSSAQSSLPIFSRTESSAFGSRTFTPSSTSSHIHTSPAAPLQSLSTNISHGHGPGPIGPRSNNNNNNNISSNKAVVAKAQPQHQPQAHANAHVTPSPIGTPAPNTSAGAGNLGNGAAGVDWSMWSKVAK